MVGIDATSHRCGGTVRRSWRAARLRRTARYERTGRDPQTATGHRAAEAQAARTGLEAREPAPPAAPDVAAVHHRSDRRHPRISAACRGAAAADLDRHACAE